MWNSLSECRQKGLLFLSFILGILHGKNMNEKGEISICLGLNLKFVNVLFEGLKK